MNTTVSKSFGLALLLAVGILAVVVALGVFSPTGAGANVKSNPEPTATLTKDGETVVKPGTEGVTLTVTFQINDDIDGAPSAAQADDNVTITVSDKIAVIVTNFDTGDITVTQGGNAVGKVDPIAIAQTIVITVADEGEQNVVKDETVTVTISGLELAATENTEDVEITQTGQSAAQTASLSIYDPDDALSGLSAELSDPEVEAEDVTLTLEFSTADGQTDDVVITLPTEYDVNDGSQLGGITVISTAGTVPAAIATGTTADVATGDTITISSPTADTDYTVTVGADTITAPATPTGGFTNPESADTFEVSFAQGTIIPAAEAMFAVVKTPAVTASVTSSKTTADTATRLTIDSPGETLGEIGPGSDIVINLPKFGLPSSISEADVDIYDGNFRVNPSEVTISGDNVTLVLGKFLAVKDDNPVPDSDSANLIDSGDKKVTITIRERAGIKTPTKAGDYPVKVDGKDADDEDGYDIGDDEDTANNPMITIVRSLSVKPKSAAVRGTEITITGKGFTDGGSTVKAGDNTIGTPTIENGSFELIVNNNIKVGGESAFGKGADGTTITAEDGAGATATASDNLVIKATFTIDPESPNPGEEITITLKDTESTSNVMVGFVGGTVELVTDDADDDKDTTWKTTVPSDVRTGVIQMSVTVGAETLTKNVTIATNPLTVSPSTAIVGQEVTVTGSGFSVAGTPVISELKIGGVDVLNEIATTARGVASGGRVVVAFRIPSDAALSEARDYTISVKDDGGRIGTGTVTIPERTLTVDPTASRIGSRISLSGAGWPTGTGVNLVGIYYDDQRYTTATSDSSGNWSASMTVPNDAGVGMTHEVAAKATVGGVADNVTKEVDHKTPDAVVTLSSGQAQRGTTITVSGENFNIFETVKIELGDSDVTPAGTTTDGVGSFSTEVLVPGQALGNKNLKVTVKGVPVVEFLEIVSTPVVTTKTVEEVFGALIDNGSLQTIWAYDFDTRGWSSYTTDPETAFANDLFEVDSGDILYINVTGQQSFSHQKGETLPDGWSLITIK